MPGQDAYRVDVVSVDGSVLVRLSGEIDLSARDDLIATVSPLIEDASSRPVALDMAEVTFLDSSGISALVTLSTQSEGIVKVHNPSDVVARTLSISGCDFLIGSTEQTP